MKPKNDKEFTAALEAIYNRIEAVADASGVTEWNANVQTLRRETITQAPWFIKKLWGSNVSATVLHPPIFQDAIYLFDAFWEKPLARRAAIMIHEVKHVLQRHRGGLSYWKYVTDKNYKQLVESEAIREELRFETMQARHFPNG